MVFVLDPTTKRLVATVHQGDAVQPKVDARNGVKCLSPPQRRRLSQSLSAPRAPITAASRRKSVSDADLYVGRHNSVDRDTCECELAAPMIRCGPIQCGMHDPTTPE